MCPRGDIFLFGEFHMGEVKLPTTYKEQIEKLRSRGCIINDDEACEAILKDIGYYRLSAYFLPFKTSDGKYRGGISFARIYHIGRLKSEVPV